MQTRRIPDENSWKTRARVFRREFVEFASDFMNKIVKNIHVPYLSPVGTSRPLLPSSIDVLSPLRRSRSYSRIFVWQWECGIWNCQIYFVDDSLAAPLSCSHGQAPAEAVLWNEQKFSWGDKLGFCHATKRSSIHRRG
jgi:hypothetical protein